MSNKRMYLLYDGRAVYDVDRASVLETLGDFKSLNAARKSIPKIWRDVDSVLVSYAVDGNKLIDEQVHL